MTKIHNLKELNKLARDLESGDYIHFTTKQEVLKYKIKLSSNSRLYLENFNNANNNDSIFNNLNLNFIEKNKLAEKCYGYKLPSSGGDWPWCNHNDYKALERLIREIYKILGEKDIKPEPIKSRFELLDL